MPSDSPRQRARPIAAADDEDARDASTTIIIVVTLVSLFGSDIVARALAFSREHRDALKVVVPALLVGAVEAWMNPSSGRAREADAGRSRRQQRFLAAGRGALIGASVGVLTDALGEKGLPALARVFAPPLGRLLAALDVPLGETTEHGLAYVVAIGAIALIAFTVRALRRTMRQHPE